MPDLQGFQHVHEQVGRHQDASDGPLWDWIVLNGGALSGTPHVVASSTSVSQQAHDYIVRQLHETRPQPNIHAMLLALRARATARRRLRGCVRAPRREDDYGDASVHGVLRSESGAKTLFWNDVGFVWKDTTWGEEQFITRSCSG
jgi:hypothetical protein